MLGDHAPSSESAVENDQQKPHCPRFLTRVTAPCIVQSTDDDKHSPLYLCVAKRGNPLHVGFTPVYTAAHSRCVISADSLTRDLDVSQRFSSVIGRRQATQRLESCVQIPANSCEILEEFVKTQCERSKVRPAFLVFRTRRVVSTEETSTCLDVQLDVACQLLALKVIGNVTVVSSMPRTSGIEHPLAPSSVFLWLPLVFCKGVLELLFHPLLQSFLFSFVGTERKSIWALSWLIWALSWLAPVLLLELISLLRSQTRLSPREFPRLSLLVLEALPQSRGFSDSRGCWWLSSQNPATT